MPTRAARYLKGRGIPYRLAEYEHLEKGARFASEALDFPLEKTIKTLVVDLGSKGCILVLMPGNARLSRKKLSQMYSAKRAEMADPAKAERLTGYKVGGISPFATRQTLPAVIEKSLLNFDKVAINGGKRGVMLIMKPADILRAAAGITIGEVAGNDDQEAQS
jgi:Cys-tRNA(Pro)/Cys-tRNA(Cys) deacylase